MAAPEGFEDLSLNATAMEFVPGGEAPVAPQQQQEPQKEQSPQPSQSSSSGNNIGGAFDTANIEGSGKRLRKLKNPQLKIEQSDPNSRFHSKKTFQEFGLRDEILKGVWAMKYEMPSAIQGAAVPAIIKDPMNHFIGQAQSGTGKTAAFALGVLMRCDENLKQPQAVIIAPTRELARQIYDVVQGLCQFTGFEILLAISRAKIPRGPILRQIIIGTSGKLSDLITKRRAIPTKHVRVFVLDEADEMISNEGMSKQTTMVRKTLPKSVQVLLFSATFGEDVQKFVDEIVPFPRVKVSLEEKELSIDEIKQFYIRCEPLAKTGKTKTHLLQQIYECFTIGQSIIFVQRVDTANALTRRMIVDGFVVSLLHGRLDHFERDHVIDEYRKGETRVLITTNVLARGIDIPQISLVINFDMPRTSSDTTDFSTYLHRIGRSGRFGRLGVAVNFVDDASSLQDVQKLEQHFGKPIKEKTFEDIEKLAEIIEDEDDSEDKDEEK